MRSLTARGPFDYLIFYQGRDVHGGFFNLRVEAKPSESLKDVSYLRGIKKYEVSKKPILEGNLKVKKLFLGEI